MPLERPDGQCSPPSVKELLIVLVAGSASLLRRPLASRALALGPVTLLALLAIAPTQVLAQSSAQSMVQVRVTIAAATHTMAADALRPTVEQDAGRTASKRAGRIVDASAAATAGEYRVVVRRAASSAGADVAKVWVRDAAGREQELGALTTVVVADGVTEAAAAAMALQMRSSGGTSPVQLTYEVQARAGLSL